MGYKVTFENGQSVVFNTQPTEADIEDAHAHVTSSTVKPSPKTSDWTRAGKSAVEAAIPAAGGLAAGVTGAGYGAAVGGLPGALVGGLIGGLGGSYLTGKLQEGAASYIPESVKERLGFGAQQRAQEVSESPTASFLGGFAPNLAAFNVVRLPL